MRDYYYILGLEPRATEQEIKSAYRKLAIKFHPDKNSGDKFFEEKFKAIQEAYETLSNYERKKSYDLQLHNYKHQNSLEELRQKFDKELRKKEEEIRRKYMSPEQKAAEEFQKKLQEEDARKKAEIQKLKNNIEKKKKNISAKEIEFRNTIKKVNTIEQDITKFKDQLYDMNKELKRKILTKTTNEYENEENLSEEEISRRRKEFERKYNIQNE